MSLLRFCLVSYLFCASMQPLCDTAHESNALLDAKSALPSLPVQNFALSLECHSIPARTEQICLATTQAEFNAVNDVVFYRRTAEQQLSLLRTEQGDVALIWLHGFSVGGKYTIVGHAEEGHPSFIIYSTNEFLTNAQSIKPVAVISDYIITSLERLDDKGIAHVRFLTSADCEDLAHSTCTGEIDIFKLK